ncbi:MAG: electron transfer flavoprotein subunit beta, partial [Anaerolineales bacterium]
MNIVVCIKQVPDSAARVVAQDGGVSWGDAPLVLNPWDEYAVEAALQQKEAYGGDVTVISMGGESAKEALKSALAMGCNEAILLSDSSLEGADSQATAQVLAAAIRKIDGVDAAF